GIQVLNGATNNTIGGITAAARNVISGNTADGITIAAPGTNGTASLGTYVGTTAAGNAALGNGQEGINVTDGTGTTIGGLTAGAPKLSYAGARSGTHPPHA